MNKTGKIANNIYTENLRGLISAGGKTAIKNARWLKAGLWAGRAASTVGLMSIMWDVAKAVGEPIGRMAVNAVDETLNSWAGRYMPELGGRIALSYMSQGAATERQRSVEALSKSSLGGRYALGREASFYHE